MTMRRAAVFVAYAGCTAAALGQSLDVHLSFDATDAPMGGIVTATLIAEFMNQQNGSYLASVNIDLIGSSSDVYEVLDVTPVPWNNIALGFDGQGVASGSDVLGIEAAQFALIPPVDRSNPILITTFTLRRIGTGSITYSARVANGAPYAFNILGGPFDGPPPYGVEVFASDTLLGTPSPGVLGVVGAGGLLAGRRRRVG